MCEGPCEERKQRRREEVMETVGFRDASALTNAWWKWFPSKFNDIVINKSLLRAFGRIYSHNSTVLMLKHETVTFRRFKKLWQIDRLTDLVIRKFHFQWHFSLINIHFQVVSPATTIAPTILCSPTTPSSSQTCPRLNSSGNYCFVWTTFNPHWRHN